MATQFLLRRLATGMAILGAGACTVVGVNSAIAYPLQQGVQPQYMAQSSSAIAGKWRLVNMTEGDSPMPMVLPRSPEVTAEFEGDRLYGSGGCNRFNGGFETSDGSLAIGPLASTFKACEEAIMQQETKYLQALQGAQRYEVNRDGLQIFYQTEQGSGVLRFVAQTSSVRALW
ncbi:MAG TPA: META domain-containing protein [Leptolyngbyaceae cyanobacterium M33_DOE_097]|uniref:META domain-containing protein n=1 Tax=Oscillatoriales cyanobacterium SpSt-418 TaxID=2282169 RepID=A0A7C3KEW0_9CYAN|nr:META domain-containing protein [Leptolyngbyaceae cyanobacterium M33_DOE_097]